MIYRLINIFYIFSSSLITLCSSNFVNNEEISADSSSSSSSTNLQQNPGGGGLFKVEGKISIPKELSFYADTYWNGGAKILLNYGEYQGFVKNDHTFVVHDVPPGSYVVEVANKEFIFEPFRIDLTSKGKIRCRRLNMLQPSLVVSAPYPVRFTAKAPARYFRAREVWRLTDLLFNPMILMMVVPFLLLMVFPKLVNTSDPEFQREVQQSLQMPKCELPDMSEYLTNWVSGKKVSKTTASRAALTNSRSRK